MRGYWMLCLQYSFPERLLSPGGWPNDLCDLWRPSYRKLMYKGRHPLDFHLAYIQFVPVCLPDPWIGAGSTPSILPSILRGNLVLISLDAWHKRRKFSTVATQRAACHHLQTLSRDGGHRELAVSVFGSQRMGSGVGMRERGRGSEKREQEWQ